MAFLITEDCTNCDACIESCPNQAIASGPDRSVIDALRCTECVGAHDEPQCQLVCPAECISQNPNFIESPEQLQAKYRQLHA